MNRKIRLYAAVTLVALFVAGCSGPCDRIDAINAPAPTCRANSAGKALAWCVSTSPPDCAPALMLVPSAT